MAFEAPDNTQSLLSALANIKGSGNFHSAGKLPFFLPGICLPDGEEIALPLSPSQAATVKNHCEAAPYGQGENTILDERVRSCWQMDASSLSWSTQWKKALQKVLKSIRKDLGIDEAIAADPYKLLLYEQGGHFKRHRDTEKLGAMFGSLIIALPSAHEGGTLTISHEGTDIAINFGTDGNWRDIQYAAFFADCEHEVLPVTSGNRLCLVYNLTLQSGSSSQLNAAISAQAATLIPHLRSLHQESGNQLFAILLDHQYTESNLSLRALKNHDNARGRALMMAAREAGFIPHLALVTLYQMGELDEDWQYGTSRYEDISDDATMGEIYEEGLSISTWRDADDQPVALPEFKIHTDQLISAEEIGSGKPLEKEAEGFTGNAGCTMEYWYRHAAIVLWPEEAHEAVLTRYDLPGCCQLLLEQSHQKSLTKKPPFLRLAHAAIKTVSKKIVSADNDFTRKNNAQLAFPLLDAILNARIDELDKACTEILLPPLLPLTDAERITTLIKRFGPDILKSLPETAEPQTQFNLLSALLSLPSPPEKIAAIIAQRTPDLLCQDDSIPHWQLQGHPSYLTFPKRLHISLGASFLITKKSTRKELSDVFSQNDSLDHLRTDLAEALSLKTHSLHFDHPDSLFPDVHQRTLATLQAKINTPLEPYPDWWRPVPEDSQQLNPELRAFMADRTAEEHRFKAVQAARTSLEFQINHHKLDIKFHTERKGSPHTLVCLKTDASYKRAVQRRKEDEILFKKLSKLTKS